MARATGALRVMSRVHGRAVHSRRVRVLGRHLAPLLPERGRVLDVGSGDGRLAALVMEGRPGLRIEGVDVLPRADAVIATRAYDGRGLPFAEGEFDAALLVDVLHHAEDGQALLAEASRVAGGRVVLKDHFRTGLAAGPTLRFMDWVGNRGHGVALPYDYRSPREWSALYERCGLEVERLVERLGLYPLPFGWVFDRGLHFVARLRPRRGSR